MSIVAAFALLLAYFFLVRKLMTSMKGFIAGSSAVVLYLILYLPSNSILQLVSDAISSIVNPIYYPSFTIGVESSTAISFLLSVIGLYYLANLKVRPRISIIFRSFASLEIISYLLFFYFLYSVENFPGSNTGALLSILGLLSVTVIPVTMFYIEISTLMYNGNALGLKTDKQIGS